MIVSSQYIHDLSNSCIKNLDYTLIFKSFNREKLLVLFESLDLSIDFELFEQLYQDATEQPFNFLYVGRLKIEKGIYYLIDLFIC